MTVYVFAGGDPSARPEVPPGATVLAANGGAAHALRLGLHVDLAVGDLDSMPPDVLDELIGDGTRLERHPVDKDKTDLELALDAALALGADRVVVVVGGAGVLDHVERVLIAHVDDGGADLDRRSSRADRRKVGIDWAWLSCDGATGKAPLGGEATGPNPTDRAKGGRNVRFSARRQGSRSGWRMTAPTVTTQSS